MRREGRGRSQIDRERGRACRRDRPAPRRAWATILSHWIPCARGDSNPRPRLRRGLARIGRLRVARGRRFSLTGSLAREVIRTRDVVSVEDFSGSARPLTKVAPDLGLGPMLLAPLIAHDVMLRVLAV